MLAWLRNCSLCPQISSEQGFGTVTAYVMLALYIKRRFLSSGLSNQYFFFLQALNVQSFLVEKKEYK